MRHDETNAAPARKLALQKQTVRASGAVKTGMRAGTYYQFNTATVAGLNTQTLQGYNYNLYR